MKINREKEIEEFLNRWTEKIYPSKEEFKKALFKRKLIIYYGIDPTSPHLHLGHSTNLLLLQKFQKLGHQIIILIGDFTAQIGDPTGRLSCRRALTPEEVFENWQSYKKQVEKVLDFKSKKNPVKIRFNSEWLNNLSAQNLVKLAANFTYGQMIKRDMFQERLKMKKEIFLHEFLYPLFQAYDSVALNCDVEVGGTDQTFNMLRGRDLLKIYKNKEKFIVCTPLLINPKTQRKLMSKTETYIGLNFPPKEMYGKIMSLPDEVIFPCFKLCTEISLSKIKEMEKWHPKEAKSALAREIVKIYHGEKAAKEAEEEFRKVFVEKKLPKEIPIFELKRNSYSILDLLVFSKILKSKSEVKRLILQKAVKIDGVLQKNWKEKIELDKEKVIQIGKRKFLKIKPVG